MLRTEIRKILGKILWQPFAAPHHVFNLLSVPVASAPSDPLKYLPIHPFFFWIKPILGMCPLLRQNM
jgi:hypothetical protein